MDKCNIDTTLCQVLKLIRKLFL